MFELPDAKRVRRDELQSPTLSPRSSPDPELEELLRSKIHSQFTFTTTDDAAQDAAHSDEEETELRLFAAPSNAPPQMHKIRLSSPTVENAEPGFAVKKPRSYYFVDEPTSDEEAAFQAAAIDGKSVLELSQLPWPGCALPWKVRTISPAGMRREVLVGHGRMLATVEEKMHKRTRKSKKTRIAIRKKLQAAKDKESEQARLAQEKQEAEREKKTRRNREKKLKKKAKEQAKKAAEGGNEEAAQDAEGSPVTKPAATPPANEPTT
ncbi:uncharacterized protein yc1106_07862 [Curvularia clavata]|uniref:Uncharacterized protein n=1 Tax=Curvularia clavata TaxID=95742 RepID=A0A9Q9DU53_CURCL|nr:uncharacterized protein yc1106_07862 [Curvularia clavata]